MTPAPETSPAQEPALKPEELDAAALKVAWEAHQRSPMDMCADSDEEAERVFAIGVAVYLAQARSVLPAAAPVGELSDTQIDAMAEQTFEKGGYLYAGLIQGAQTIRDMAARALAAAPVTGDRETAGVELAAVHKLTRPLAVDTMDEAVRVLLAQMRPDKRPTSITDESWAHHLAWVIGFDTLVEERARLHALSTPPSGGGDHAGPEAEGGAAMESATRAVWLADGGLAEDYDRALAADEEFAEDHRRWAEAAVSAYFAATARPAAAEGSAEVSCKENGGSAATTDASCKAAEPVTSGKLREAVENVVVRMSYGGVLYRSDPETKALIAALAPSTTSAASDGEGNNA